MYGINKEKKLTEETLDHLSGYKGSKPVRVGNAAYAQRQNDIYGILMDVIYEQLKRFSTDIENGEEIWSITKGIVWIVEKHWQEADKGIWEFRSEDKHFTFSKVLCWTAIDRAIKVAQMMNKTHKIEMWKPLREEIWNDIYEKAWNEKVGAYTQSYGTKHLDASVLLMESYGCIDAKDERFVSTVKAIGRELSNNGLLYRYKNEDDFGEPFLVVYRLYFLVHQQPVQNRGRSKKRKPYSNSYWDTATIWDSSVKILILRPSAYWVISHKPTPILP